MKKQFILGMLAGVVLTAAGIGTYTYVQADTTVQTAETLNLDDDADFATACDLMGQIVDWETDGEELAVMTADGYEMYAYKSAEIYD